MSLQDAIAWIRDEVSAKNRRWEEFYRNRWQHDRVVRSTHGVNCTGGCTWNIYVKNGIVTWEMQGLDYPALEAGLPPYEPRGCQRGISASWYIYSPLRVKYPYIRGALLDAWRRARADHADPVDAWAAMVDDPATRQRWQVARGKGGFRRTSWETAEEIMAAAMVHTIRKHGPDRIAGFSPIPAMSMVSYASGARLMQLIGGISLSFYDWYCDLPPASPETWGEQTDVQESADWYHAKMLVSMGANIGMTRTPDCHFLAESLSVILLHEVPLAARAIAAFGERCERSTVAELEEIYTRTFEINSKCAPEIGWHLFGEEFTRGMLLVRLREELERYGIPETTELPDHILMYWRSSRPCRSW